jgi:hypothetical protein
MTGSKPVVFALGTCWLVFLAVVGVYTFLYFEHEMTPIGCWTGQCEDLGDSKSHYKVEGSLPAGEWKYYTFEVTYETFHGDEFTVYVEHQGGICYATSNWFLPQSCSSGYSYETQFCAVPNHIIVGIYNPGSHTTQFKAEFRVDYPDESLACLGPALEFLAYLGGAALLALCWFIPLLVVSLACTCVLCKAERVQPQFPYQYTPQSDGVLADRNSTLYAL